MEDIFNEKLIKKLPSGKDLLLKGAIGAVAIVIMTVSLMFTGLMCIPIVLTVGVIAVALYFAGSKRKN